MSHLVSAVTDLFHSFYELFASFFTTLFNLVYGLVDGVVSFITGVLSLFAHTVTGVLEVVGETGKFLVGNLFFIAIIGGGAWAYLRYQKQQGNAVVVGDKKLN